MDWCKFWYAGGGDILAVGVAEADIIALDRGRRRRERKDLELVAIMERKVAINWWGKQRESDQFLLGFWIALKISDEQKWGK